MLDRGSFVTLSDKEQADGCFGLGAVIVLQGSARVVNPAGKRSEALRCYPLY